MVQTRSPASNDRARCFTGTMRRVAAAATAVFALLAATVAAAPPWTAPQNVSSASLFVDTPDVVFAAGGRAIATWRWRANDDAGGTRLAVREPGALDFGPERGAPNFVTPLVTYSRDRLVGLDARRRSRTRVSLRARFGDSLGTFGPPRTISTYTEAGGPPSLAGPNGSLVAWIAGSSHGRRIVRAAVKSRGRFRHSTTLRGRGRANDVIAGEAQGVKFVAWERGDIVEARVRRTGRRWGPVQRLGNAEPFATTFAAVGSGGRAYVAWLAESAASAVVRVAVLPAAKTRFRAAQTVETVQHEPPDERHALALVPIPDRDALLAWTGWDGTHWRVKAANTASASPTFSDGFAVSAAGQSAVLGDAAAAPIGTRVPGGTVMLAWSVLDAVGEVGDRVQTAIRPPLGPFGPPEEVSDLDRARLPAVAFDPNTRRWATVWSQRIGPDGPGVPQSQITTFARSSTRPG